VTHARGSRRAIRLGAWLAGGAIVAVLLFLGLRGTSSEARVAPALPAERLSGEAVTLAQLRGRPAFVVFWASWCGPCRQEAPALERFATTLGGRGHMVGVNWEDQLPGARAFVRTYRWSFPTLRDAGGRAGEAYGVSGLPTTFVLDAQGHIHEVLRGPQSERTLGRALARLG